MTQRTKVFFLMPSFQAGGAERVASILLNHWALEGGYELIACTFDEKKHDFYTLNKSIRRLIIPPLQAPQDILGRISLILSRLIALRRLLRKYRPDVLVSFMDRPGLLSILASIGLGIPTIISERTNPLFYNHGNLYDRLKRRIFPWAAAFVAQTSEVGQWAEEFMGKSKVIVIPNPVGEEFQASPMQDRQKIILSVGRLCMEKGFDMLIEAFSLIAKRYPDWKLQIVGGGDQEELLRALIVKYGLVSQVELTGASSSPQSYMQNAAIYVTSSRVEGFPNALLEAMASGMPPISFDFSCGPRDLIEHQKNGLLVKANDCEALAQVMAYLIENDGMRSRLAEAAKDVQNQYATAEISSRWRQLIDLLSRKSTSIQKF